MNNKNERHKIKLQIEQDETTIAINGLLDNGDYIEFIFDSPLKEKYAGIALYTWISIISEYTIGDDNKIYLNAKDYWNIYKNLDYGRQFLEGTGYTMQFNHALASFVSKSYYFNSRSIYGIYYEDELLYVGCSGNYMERWDEHDRNFRSNGAYLGYSHLYQQNYNADIVEYKILLDIDKIQEITGFKNVGSWTIEEFERILIEILNPKWNVEGKSKPYYHRSLMMKSEKKLNEEQIRKKLIEMFDVPKPV